MSRKHYAYHEAGHAVMAASLGYTVERVGILPGQLSTKVHIDRALDHIQVLLAGELAERIRFHGKTAPYSWAGDAEALAVELEAFEPAERPGAKRFYRSMVRRRLRIFWPAVELLAARLLVEGEIVNPVIPLPVDPAYVRSNP